MDWASFQRLHLEGFRCLDVGVSWWCLHLLQQLYLLLEAVRTSNFYAPLSLQAITRTLSPHTNISFSFYSYARWAPGWSQGICIYFDLIENYFWSKWYDLQQITITRFTCNWAKIRVPRGVLSSRMILLHFRGRVYETIFTAGTWLLYER